MSFYYKLRTQLEEDVEWAKISLFFIYAFAENVTLWNGEQQETITLYENSYEDNLTNVLSQNSTFRDDILCSHIH